MVNIIAALLYTPWMVREIGQTNYGLYTLATSLISLFLIDFGISAALSRFLSKYRAEKNDKEIERLLGATYSLYIGIDLIILIIVSFAYFNLESIYAELTVGEIQTFKILFLVVAIFNLISFPATTLNGILTSYEKFTQLKICDLVRKFLTILFVVCALYLQWGVIAVVAANVAAGLITIGCKLIIIKTQIKIRPSYRNLDRRVYKGIFSFSIWITLISFAQKFIYNMAPSVLGIVSGAVAISVYAPAAALGSYFYAIAEAANGLFLPLISRKIANNRESDISTLMIKVGKFQIILLGWIFVGFVCVGKSFMILWMGSDFENSYYCSILVFLPALFEYSQQIGKTTIIAKNKVKYQAIGFVIIGIITLVFSFFLGRYWGAIGVSISVCLAGCANVILQSYIFSHMLNINMNTFYKKCLLPMLWPISLGIILGLLVTNSLNATSWKSIIICGVLVSLIYFGLCRIFALSKEEIMEIISLR